MPGSPDHDEGTLSRGEKERRVADQIKAATCVIAAKSKPDKADDGARPSIRRSSAERKILVNDGGRGRWKCKERFAVLMVGGSGEAGSEAATPDRWPAHCQRFPRCGGPVSCRGSAPGEAWIPIAERDMRPGWRARLFFASQLARRQACSAGSTDGVLKASGPAWRIVAGRREIEAAQKGRTPRHLVRF